MDATSRGDGVVEIGHATLTVYPEGRAATGSGMKYFVYWRQEDGRWKKLAETYNSDQGERSDGGVTQ